MSAVSSLCKLCLRWRARNVAFMVPAPLSAVPSLSPALLAVRGLRCGAALLHQTDGEKDIADILSEKLSPSYLQVRDISGGCGSMYEIVIDSEKFKGKRMLLQHKMVNEALGEEVVKSLHGLTIRIGDPTSES